MRDEFSDAQKKELESSHKNKELVSSHQEFLSQYRHQWSV